MFWVYIECVSLKTPEGSIKWSGSSKSSGDGEGVFITFHSTMCNVYKAMSHVVLSQSSIVCTETQLPAVNLEYLKYFTCMP